MNEHTRHLIKKCALKNDDLRETFPINHITHDIVQRKSNKPKGYIWPKTLKYKYDHWHGSLILSPKVLSVIKSMPS